MGIERITTDPEGRPVIRGLPIRFWDLYRDLSLHGMTAEDLLRKYPGLESEDIRAVFQYALHLIRGRTHQQTTGRPLLARDELKPGGYYKGTCRHGTIARWDGSCFWFWRRKFERIYLQRLPYPTDADAMDLLLDYFEPLEELPHCKFEIPFADDAEFIGDPDHLHEFAAGNFPAVEPSNHPE